MDPNTHSIAVSDLTKRYGSQTAIDTLNFHLDPGETVGFLGPNGAGKTTTMKILSGLLPATSGSASVCGTSIALYPQKVKKHIAFLPENNPLPEDLRVIEYLKLRARLKEIPKNQQKERIYTAMEACELIRTCERKIIRTLSKGFRQRVGIADCLLAQPDVLILDEPTIGLDPHQILNVRAILKHLKGKLSIILSSHILPEIEPLCDRFIIINKGHIIAQGTKAHLQQEFNVPNQYSFKTAAPLEFIQNTIPTIIPEAKIEHISQNHYKILDPCDQNYSQQIIHTFCIDHKFEIEELERKAASLEDIFISATVPAWKSSTQNYSAA